MIKRYQIKKLFKGFGYTSRFFLIKFGKSRLFKDFYLNTIYNRNTRKKLPIRRLNIEFTPICNLNCKYCDLDGKRRDFFSESLLIKLLNEITSSKSKIKVREIVITLGGEATLHPKFRQLLDIIAKYKSKYKNFPTVTLTSNGTTIKHKALDMIESGALDEIRFSIDGGNKVDYESIRRFNWNQIIDNVHHIIKKRNNLNSKLKIGIVTIISGKPNLTKEFIQLINRVDYYYPRNLHNWTGSDNFGIDDIRFKPQTGLCSHIMGSMGIFADGIATACCRDLNQNVIIGDFNKETLYDIFFGKKRTNMMKLMKNNKRQMIPYCSKCSSKFA